ncbi:maleylacetate reductase [Novosphingobium resinovorum]|uniref:Maleylacetate reductase n=1 Tax=Novosphingobium resinovorum TaxID=158500 RepID=Q2TPV8_9SPHN|nr:maleylacetate reductase [Novosphingobium resinovorum]AAW29743.1 maleylacetate reductase [Novosphingobium resinovorum]AOR81201.1 maleylacetate reductase [Novosphingobium resinovorum]
MQPFVYETAPARVVFGRGTSQNLRRELEALNFGRALVLSTPDQKEQSLRIAQGLGSQLAGSFHAAAMHTPVEVTLQALEVLKDVQADCIVAIGGGSTIGLGKALALRTDLPQIVVPTTYAGSEMTPILGETENGLKTTQRNPKVQPRVVLYDVDLTVTLPVQASVTSGMNAIAHAAEALYARDGNPVISLMAEEAIRALAHALPRIVATPDDIEARSDALYGAWLCGTCLGSAGMALHHKLCHTLGGSFDLPHAPTHTVILPYALAYNSDAARPAMAAIARALGMADAAMGMRALSMRLGAPTSLRELGMAEADLDRAADLATQNAYWNPRPIEHGPIRNLLGRAWAGTPV